MIDELDLISNFVASLFTHLNLHWLKLPRRGVRSVFLILDSLSSLMRMLFAKNRDDVTKLGNCTEPF